MFEGPVDPTTCDRDVRRVVERLALRRAQLATPEGREEARHADPFGERRYVSSLSTYRALETSKPSALDVPLRDGLLRFVYELLQSRIDLELEIDDAEALHERGARVPEDAPTPTPEALRLRPEEAHSFLQAARALLETDGPARASTALARWAELASPVAAVRRERRERRVEAARRVGLAHPASLTSATSIAEVIAAARSLLDATDGLSEALLKEERRRQEVPWSAASTIHLALARTAAHGWPAHLGRRWLEDVFKHLLGRPLPGDDRFAVPRPLGGATFLRAAYAFGVSLRTFGTARALPFALARDPYPTSAHRFGFALASTVAEPPFQRRALDLAGGVAEVQTRALRTSLFLGLRTAAVRFLLTETETSGADFEELTTRVFGKPLPASLHRAWPAPRVDEAARFVALLGTPTFVADLVARFDEDWFRNPRAGAHLTSLACAPAHVDEPLPPDAPAAIARTFERWLG